MPSPDMLLWVQWQLCGSPRLQLKSALFQFRDYHLQVSIGLHVFLVPSLHQHVCWVNLHCFAVKDPNVCLKTDFSTSKHLQDLLPPAAMDTDAPLESWNKSSEQD